MGKYDFIKIKKKLSKYLDEARFEHIMGVKFTNINGLTTIKN